MRRRNFIAGLASTTAVWPVAAGAQQPPIQFIGLLVAANVPNWQFRSIQKGLNEGGFIEGRNLAIMYRSADGQFDLLPSLANDLVTSKVSVILAVGGRSPRVRLRRPQAQFQLFLPTAAIRSVTISLRVSIGQVEMSLAQLLLGPRSRRKSWS